MLVPLFKSTFNNSDSDLPTCSCWKSMWHIIAMQCCLQTDAASWHLCCFWKRVFRLSAGQCPIRLCQRYSSAAGARCQILSHPRSGCLTHWTSTRWTTACGVCFRSESIVPRSQAYAHSCTFMFMITDNTHSMWKSFFFENLQVNRSYTTVWL